MKYFLTCLVFNRRGEKFKSNFRKCSASMWRKLLTLHKAVCYSCSGPLESKRCAIFDLSFTTSLPFFKFLHWLWHTGVSLALLTSQKSRRVASPLSFNKLHNFAQRVEVTQQYFPSFQRHFVGNKICCDCF